ncbi:MAG: haloalkane dehalogenase [Phototrophicales bacterium]|nr:MAG: haloalkane dehalogenase [Phototrophicales bacterium]
MPVIRTPEERFSNLNNFPYTPHYIDWEGKRIHYVDEGTGHPILCLHGEPTWSYLYRHMISEFKDTHRAIAFDFIGFGRSDKYTETSEYSFELHQSTLLHVINTLDLQNITLIVHDWGGLIGLPTLPQIADRITHLVILNTFLPIGDIPPSRGFLAWRKMIEKMGTNISVAKIMRQALPPEIPDEVIAGYDAPFLSDEYKAGVAVWPLMVPIQATDSLVDTMQEARNYLNQWQKPTLIMFAVDDPILGRGGALFRHLIPHAKYIEIEHGGHFLQESRGIELAKHIRNFLETSKNQHS